MAIRVEARVGGVGRDGVEAWWDEVEGAAQRAPHHYPLLSSISPCGDVTILVDRLSELAAECDAMAAESSPRANALLMRIADLARRTVAGEFDELRFDGD